MYKKLGLVKFSALMIGLVVIIWSAGWFLLAWRLERGFSAWLAKSDHTGVQITSSTIALRGFPFRLQAVLTGPELNLMDNDASFIKGHWRAEKAVARFSVWSIISGSPSLSQVQINGSQLGGFNLLGFDLTGQVDSDHFVVSFDPSEDDPIAASGDMPQVANLSQVWRATVTSNRLSFANGSNDDVYSFGKMAAQVRLYSPVAANPIAPSMAISLHFEDMQWLGPDPNADLSVNEEGGSNANVSLQPKLQTKVLIQGRLLVNGTLPAGKFQDALVGWRDSGGNIDIKDLKLQTAGVGATASGTVTIDSENRLLGTMVIQLPRVEPALAQLVAAQDLSPAEADQWLSFINSYGQGDLNSPKISFTAQNGLIATPKGVVARLPDYLTIDSLSTDQE
ncbi:MAG: DUF2125 domain-containing protein [Candidatus Pacebacteria bacterium]|nr:DUF2125 domain-containing protein [Candidatus Paceibacterota bacterium]